MNIDYDSLFCFVDDLINGIVKLLESDYSKPVNIGNPSEITISQFAEEIISLTGTEQKVIYKDLPVDDPKQRKPDITKAKEILNWSSRRDIKDIVSSAWDAWQLGHK